MLSSWNNQINNKSIPKEMQNIIFLEYSISPLALMIDLTIKDIYWIQQESICSKFYGIYSALALLFV